jgi:formylglycine-generating enzyme required for sulfatase activity
MASYIIEKRKMAKPDELKKQIKALPVCRKDNFDKSFGRLACDRTDLNIPATRLERWDDYLTLFENGSRFVDQNLIFRGQAGCDWSLMTTLGRNFGGGYPPSYIRTGHLENFRKAIRGRVSETILDEKKDNEIWALGQHHGLQTPLLDWSYSPYVALFFAFWRAWPESEAKNPYRVVYVLNRNHLALDEIETERARVVEENTSSGGVSLFEPRKDSYGRLVNQAGLFTVAPVGATIEKGLRWTIANHANIEESKVVGQPPEFIARYICRIFIPNEKDTRRDCLNHLRRMNIHDASLFPDLIGAAAYCNYITPDIAQEKQVEAREPATAIPSVAAGFSTKETGDERKHSGAGAKEKHSSNNVTVLHEIKKIIGTGEEIKFILIPGGEFMMGSPDNDKDAVDREKPQHKVIISQPFYLGKYPVTQKQWWAMMGNNPSLFSGDKNPVESVSWNDVQEFIRRLNKKNADQYRLPTEAEWEYACRAETTTKYSFADDEELLGKYAWYDGNSVGQTCPVGIKAPNLWGLCDMHGNVWEWVADWYGHYPKGEVTDPTGAERGVDRVLRGGSWINGARYLRSAYRGGITPADGYSSIGFRLAFSPGRS